MVSFLYSFFSGNLMCEAFCFVQSRDAHREWNPILMVHFKSNLLSLLDEMNGIYMVEINQIVI